ncbi:MAG: hypothetical protein JHC33_09200 [Ignisphaera sp.]|nr:hypothetical protein [Ignisphaera sp.]
MPFLTKGRSCAVVNEVTFGAANPTIADADYIDFTGCDVGTDIAMIERNVMRNSMVALEPVLGQESSSGSISVELSSTAAGILNGTKLFANGIGKMTPQAVATTTTASSTTSLVNVTTAAGLVVGQVLKVEVTTGAFEFTQITNIAALAISVDPALSSAPVAGKIAQGLLTYTLPKPSDAVSSLAVRENLKPTSGSPIDYTYLGVMASNVALDYPVGGIATAGFTLAGAGFTINASGSTPTLPCAIATPIVGKNGSVTVMGTAYDTKDLKVSIATTMTDVNAITTDGISNKLGTAKAVTGSFKTPYTGANDLTTFKAGTKGAIRLLLKDGGKTSPVIHGIIAPVVKFTKVKASDDAGVLYNTIDFQIMSPDCGTVERAVSVFFV